MNKLSEFDFLVPEELVAQRPLERRDASRMLVLDRRSGRIEHARFLDIPSYIHAGDTMVFNQSKVIKARILGTRPSGGKVEVFLLRQLRGNSYECLVKLTAAQKQGVEFRVDEGFRGRIGGTTGNPMLYEVELETDSGTVQEKIEQLGRVPLPPYIRREPDLQDLERYQTVYASISGSVAAPTAGLHFTPEVLAALRAKPVAMEYVTLHVGLGTFQPIKTEILDEHKMHVEEFSVPDELKGEKLLERRKSGRVVAVGTTSVRALESAARGMEEATDLFLRPGSEFKAVDALFTNFHQPKSSLVVMLAAFVGSKELLFEAYAKAVEEKYRFFSYGDCMLVL